MAGGQLWKSSQLVRTYLSGVRAAIPLAAEQIEMMLRIVRKARPQVESFLDLGCGDGILGLALLSEHPQARGVLVDISPPMIRAARRKGRRFGGRLQYVVEDYGRKTWTRKVAARAPFDAVVSGFSIHHQPDKRKRELYAEIYRLLKPGGVFINIEHVSSSTPWLGQVFDDCFVDALYQHQAAARKRLTREAVAAQFYNRPDKNENILAPVDDQCRWLRQSGFEQVDCYLRILELAVFGGVKPNKGRANG